MCAAVAAAAAAAVFSIDAFFAVSVCCFAISVVALCMWFESCLRRGAKKGNGSVRRHIVGSNLAWNIDEDVDNVAALIEQQSEALKDVTQMLATTTVRCQQLQLKTTALERDKLQLESDKLKLASGLEQQAFLLKSYKKKLANDLKKLQQEASKEKLKLEEDKMKLASRVAGTSCCQLWRKGR
eukprot:TRINITY_DN1045_c0_g2_i1.p1 TRINITY_DN1045_c0_g2~~TRINITY_DN1045_c0_g2_i1.p1  ORF type:complete len:183 (-),score=56.64 TRINITY_DN1045_c0_g2_i1:136-684(-)